MAGSVDSIFGIYANALQQYNKRAVVLGNNIANAETPGFKARDMDVPGILRGERDKLMLAMQKTTRGHLPAMASPMDFSIQYRAALQGSADKNTVNSQEEKVAFTQNAIHYRASLSFVNGTIRGLMTAIRGE